MCLMNIYFYNPDDIYPMFMWLFVINLLSFFLFWYLVKNHKIIRKTEVETGIEL